MSTFLYSGNNSHQWLHFQTLRIIDFSTHDLLMKSDVLFCPDFLVDIRSQFLNMQFFNRSIHPLINICQIKQINSKVKTIWFPSYVPLHCRLTVHKKFCPSTYSSTYYNMVQQLTNQKEQMPPQRLYTLTRWIQIRGQPIIITNFILFNQKKNKLSFFFNSPTL